MKGLGILRVGIITPYNIFVGRLIGSKILQRRLAEYLCMKGHEVFVVVPRRKHQPRVFVKGLRVCYVEAPLLYRLFRGTLATLLRGIHWPASLRFVIDMYFMVFLCKFVKNLQPDVLCSMYFEALFPSICVSQLFGLPLCHVEVDVEYRRLEQLNRLRIEKVSTLGLLLLRSLEGTLCNAANVIVALTFKEKEALEALGVKKRIEVIPLGVDTKTFRPLSKEESRKIIAERHGLRDQKILFFHGASSYEPNRDALILISDYIIPRLLQTGYDVVCIVVAGPKPQSLPKFSKRILCLDFVEDLPLYINAADICIVPLRAGGGMSFKTIEYLSCGKPVVTTGVGARGLTVRNRIHAIVESEVNEKFVEAISYLMDNPGVAEKLGSSGRRLVQEQYSWDNVCESYVTLMKSIVS